MIGLEGLPRYAEIIRRLTELESPELVPPGLYFEQDAPEWWGLGNVKLWAVGFFLAAVAAQRPLIRVVNPTGSGVLERIDDMIISTNGVIRLQVGPAVTLTDLAAVANALPTDMRWGVPPTATFPVARIRVSGVGLSASISALNQWVDLQVLASTPTWVPIRPVLQPGSGFELSSPSVNNDIMVCITGRERGARGDELLSFV